MLKFFCWKNVSSFCSAKATPTFSAKNIRILYIESAKTVNEMTLNELVKLTTLWITGPCMSCRIKNLIYVIRCCGCNKEYIFETGDTLCHQATVHRQQIRNSSTRMLYVSWYITTCARMNTHHSKYFHIIKCKKNWMTSKDKDTHFIKLFKPKLWNFIC